MVINAISKLGTRLLDTNRTRETGGASRTRRFMSIRATHRAAYNATTGDEAEAEDSLPSAPPAVDDAAEAIDVTDRKFETDASSSVSRRVGTLDDAEDAYASN